MSNSTRIQGLDFARALAVIIMILVNFRAVLAETTSQGWLVIFLNALQGKGAALFVVLAGTGISIMLNPALAIGDSNAVSTKQTVLIKRAAFLFVFGLLFMPFWRADILHYYGLFISIGALVATVHSRWLWLLSAVLVLAYPFLLEVIDYDTGWNWENFRYTGFWTPAGFLRNLLVNGFHPVIPWLAFVFAGVWLGRLNLTHRSTQLRIALVAGSVFALIETASWLLLAEALTDDGMATEEAIAVFGTQPMPPLPLYMFSAISLSFAIIVLCIRLTDYYADSLIIDALIKTGQMAFTLYVAHVVVGMNILIALLGENSLSLSIVFWYSLEFCVASVWFSWWWRKHHSRGPMSLLMRRISG